MTTHTTLAMVLASGHKLTPMITQYAEIKKVHMDKIVLFRMGDFYEVFFEDAVRASQVLNITLTHRGKIGDLKIPMAGIPHHAASSYIDRMTSKGIKVAICEQIEDPKEAKGIVKRAVTQVATPALPYDLDKMEKSHHWITCAKKVGEAFYLLALDFTTGEFVGYKLKSEEDFLEKLRLLSPREFICYLGQWEDIKTLSLLIEHTDILQTHLSEEYFEEKFNSIFIEKLLPQYKKDKIITSDREILGPIGALSYYTLSTGSKEELSHIKPFKMIFENGLMKVSLPTLQGLEILPKTPDDYKNSLLGFMDKTKTAMGARTLKSFFLSPLNEKEEIEKRHSLVSFFTSRTDLLQEVRDSLSDVRDIERILTKVSLQKASGGDLLNLSYAIHTYQAISKILKGLPAGIIPKISKKQKESLLEISSKIDKAINPEIGASLEKGNLINKGYCKKRDRLARLAGSAHQELEALELRYREETGIQKLRVKSNNVAGFFIEVSKIHSKKMPDSFERRQTLVNTERYTTEELGELEKDMLSAKDKLEKLERKLFKELTGLICDDSQSVMQLVRYLSHVDVFASFSWVAICDEFIRPEVLSDQKVIQLEGAFHPLIKAKLKDEFISHSLQLNEDQFFGLITGPNMAGKTTVMREVAIITLLSQVGSFVPATSAKLGLKDYIFSRLGASDDILRGQSTFMVEMSETAEILRHASENSLIILDEVGRGTSTYDGLSIAWSLVEHLLDRTKAIGLFATHYHELIELVAERKEAKNLTVKTKSDGDEIRFQYALVEESASQSFGLYVAKLAGLPPSIIKRSKEILDSLEKNEPVKIDTKKTNETNSQLDFFAPVAEGETPEYLLKIEDDLDDIDLFKMTPLDAMNKLNDLKNILKESKSLQ